VFSSAALASSRKMSAETSSGVCGLPWKVYCLPDPMSRLTSWATRSGASSTKFFAARPTTACRGDSK
jgi:hypothetical protein